MRYSLQRMADKLFLRTLNLRIFDVSSSKCYNLVSSNWWFDWMVIYIICFLEIGPYLSTLLDLCVFDIFTKSWKTFRELFQINTSEMNSPQPMSLIQHLAVLHHCLRCQLGTGFGSKYLLQDVSKLLILSKFFNFSRNKGVFSGLLWWLSRKLRHRLPTKKVYFLIYLICKEFNFSI